jgi:hypothetical protein
MRETKQMGVFQQPVEILNFGLNDNLGFDIHVALTESPSNFNPAKPGSPSSQTSPAIPH